MQSLNKLILKTALWTLAGLFIVGAYGLGFWALLFPEAHVHFANNLGAYGAAALAYRRIYERDKTPENLYMLLEKYIAVGNHADFTELAPTLFNDAEYMEIIADVNAYMRAAADTKFEYAVVANTDDRLKRAYITSLLALGKGGAAEEFYEGQIFAVNLQTPNFTYFSCETAEAAKFADYFTKFRDEYDARRAGLSANEKIVPLYFIIFVLGKGVAGADGNLAAYEKEYAETTFTRAD